MMTGLLELRFDDVANQGQHLWFRFKQPGLRTGVLHQFYRQPFHLFIAEVLFDQFFRCAVIHLTRASWLSPIFSMSLERTGRVADLAGNHDQHNAYYANDQRQGTHRPEIAVDIEMIQQRPQWFGPRRIEKYRGAKLA